MAHHKRGKRKKARAGCLLCKPWKCNGVGRDRWTMQERRARIGDKESDGDQR